MSAAAPIAVRSTKDKVTGAIKLLPLTVDATGVQVPAKEAPRPTCLHSPDSSSCKFSSSA